MEADLSYCPKHVDEWCNDIDFVNKRNIHQLSMILDSCLLTSKQFKKFFEIIKSTCNMEEVLVLMKHTHFASHDCPAETFSILNNVAEILEVPFIQEINEDIKYFQSGKSIPEKQHDEPLKTATSDENTRKLRELPLTEDNFYEIFKILTKASREDDQYTIKVAVDEKYCNVRTSKLDYDSLLFAALKGENKLARYLVKYGANPRTKSRNLDTILKLYTMRNDLEGVKFAIEFIDINSQDDLGNAALHYSVYNNNYEITKFLISQPGANLFVSNKGKMTSTHNEILKALFNSATN